MRIFLEVSDIYGNTITTNVISIQVHASELIPYLLIGVIIGFAIGLASLTSILYKKLEKKRQISQDRLLHKSAKEESKISFMDKPEEDL